MIGGGGEKKTLRLVAQYADACNLGVHGELPTHKLDVLRGHCDAVGRDYDDIEKTAMIAVDPDSTPASVATQVEALAGVGFTATYVYALRMPEPERVVDVIAGAAELVG
jgi:hypothetical protein